MTENYPRRGDIWWVKFPSEDKLRPAVIISPNVRNHEGENVIVAGCTTQRTEKVYDDEVRLDGLELESSTKVQCDYLYTIKQSLLQEKETELLDYHRSQLEQALKVAIGIF